ncbi:MAG: ABC transporter substrate-binding protein, partial [Rhodospirillales bacterium]|nr:ABC transporter substrate-binding protein [Rhodospirillales bacterium]
MSKFARFLGGAALAATVVATMPSAPFAEEPKRGGTLVQAIQNTPRHLNPAVQSGIATGEPGTQLFASLLRYDESWTPEPYLAKSWEVSHDGLSVTLKLVEGATFHDGHPITSEDVAFSIETVKAYHPFKSMFAPVEQVKTPDAHTVVVVLSQPHPALLLAMSSQLLSIIPKHIYGDGQDPKTHPRNSENVVGSGPFKLVEFKRDQHIILERYENYVLVALE